MWVVEACFEGNEEPYKKLLKPGKRYQIGRKAPAQLILAEKTVSQDAGFLEVQAWAPPVQSLKDASRLPAWPMLRLHVGKKVIRAIPRDDQAHWEANRDTFIGEEAQPTAVREMADGEHIVVSRSAPPMRILWVPMMFCVSPGIIADIELREQHQSLASLGIAIIEAETLDPNCTHFVTNATSPTAPFLDALVSCVHIVTGEYIAELIRADASEDGGTTSTLELEYTLPDAQENFPPNDSDLDSTTYEEVKSKSPPDERRKSIFSGITILFASTDEVSKAAFKAREPVFYAAGARIETVAPSLFARLGDEDKVERYLQAKLGAAKNRAGQLASPGVSSNAMVIIASAPVQPPEAWHTLFAKVSRKLKIPMPNDGIDALSHSVMLTAPARFLKRLAPEPEEDESFSQAITEQREGNDEFSSPRHESGQRDDVPPPAQQNQTPAVRASGEEDPLQQPSVPQTQVQPTQASTVAPTTPSRRPKRRAGIERADPFADLFGSSASAVDSAMPPPAAESQASEVGATQISPSRGGAAGSIRGLRRNVTAAKEQPRRSDVWRSIFEDSTPSASSTGQSSNDGAHNATQGGSTQERYTKRFRMELDAVDQRESQRENQGASQQTQADPDVTMRPSTEPTQRPAENGRKRRAEEDAEDERDVAEVTQRAEAAAPGAVPSATPAAEDATPTNAKDGAAKSSTQAKTLGSDAKFLQSIASMKSAKGKKQVDPLDKEFDRLRIVRPNHGPAASGKKGGTQATTLVGQASVEDAEYRAWQEMTVDDFDVGAAGKFIQVDFVPLVRQRTSGGADESAAADRSTDTQGSWAGRPNFKKFRAKGEKDRSQPVPLVLHVVKGKDSDTGQMYDVVAIKGARQRVTQARTDAASSAKATQSATQKKKSIFAKESDEEEENTGRGSRIKSGRAPTRGAAESWGMTSARPRVRSTGSHEDDEDGRSSRSKSPVKLSGKKKANTVVDVRLDIDGDPMDDNDVFSDDNGGGTQSRAARKRKQPTQLSRKKEARGVVVVVDSDDEEEDQIVDDDSDGDYGFQGFKRKRTQGTSLK